MSRRAFLILFLIYTSIFASPKPKVDYHEWSMVLPAYIGIDGNVNYSKLKKDHKLLHICLQKFSTVKIDNDWSTNEKIAFWINVYNAYTLKLIIDNYPVESIKDIDKPWDKEFFTIDGEAMSLGKVEHKILRKFNDPRIHFAINCASSSCPRILQVPYKSENVDRLLTRQTKEYINNPVYNEITKDYYKLTKLFTWFGKDFKNKETPTIVDFVNQYSNIKIVNQYNKGHLKYNWVLNDQR